MDGLNMKITVRVDGKEGLQLDLAYENTDMKTVLMVEEELIKTLQGLIVKQKAKK